MVNAAEGGPRRLRTLRVAYGLASIALVGLYPVLPGTGREFVLIGAIAGAGACVAYGRRRVRSDLRSPWTLLLGALVAFLAAGFALLLPTHHATTVRWLIDAVGNLLVLAAALALIIGRRSRDVGGIIDAAVIAFAAGSVLWVFLPHRLDTDGGFAAQLDLFVVVVAFAGVLGALVRVATTGVQSNPALRWLLAAVGIAIIENILRALAGADTVSQTVAAELSIVALAATGQFGLDPTAPALMRRQPTVRSERLSVARLAFLCAAVAAFPIVVGIRALLRHDTGGALLAAQGVAVAALVMLRIGVLSFAWARAERALEHQASHDPLTQLLNRREFIARLADVLARGERCAVVFCDLDNFKAINDIFGHDAGDRLLIEVAQRLTGCVQPPHVVSRFGGDEFVALLIDATDEETEAIRSCLTSVLARPFEQAGGAPVGISIGVARSEDATDPDELLRAADRFMYAEKTQRRSAPWPPGVFPGQVSDAGA
ncbi:MAG: GGDEF domain-containing protein [Micromonosporaceae bacterium]|nr:GGDEF domain-containing protein [Micromonosporaceae bacterium]